MTCSYFYFTTHFSLLTFERKLLLSTDDLCTLNSLLILAYSFASQFAAYLNTRLECFVFHKGILGPETCISWKHVLLVEASVVQAYLTA